MLTTFMLRSFSLLLLCFLGYNLYGSEIEQTPQKIKEYSDLQVLELTLDNGMRVVLKKTDDDSEVSAKMVALGGFASEPSEDRVSCELAADVVLESGAGNLSDDKFDAYLYDHSIELNLKIEPFTRSIDASFPEDSVDSFFSLINNILTKPNFNQGVFANVITKKKNELLHKCEHSSIDDILNLVSVQEKDALNPLKIKDFEKANFEKAKQFFLKAFSNPSDFVCVIAGDIDIEKTKNLAIQHFSQLSNPTKQKFVQPQYKSAPKAMALRTQNLPKSCESLVRIALPLQVKLDYTKLEQLELICQIMESRLRNVVKNHSCDAKGVDVGYELPLYPSLEHPWLTIQFHIGNDHSKSAIALVFDEFQHVAQKGFTAEEIKLAAKIKRQSLQLWEHDNDYWIVLLSNHYLWGWDPEKISNKFKDALIMDAKEIQATLNSALLIDEFINRE